MYLVTLTAEELYIVVAALSRHNADLANREDFQEPEFQEAWNNNLNLVNKLTEAIE